MTAEARKVLYARVPPALHEGYKALADDLGVSINDMVLLALSDAFPAAAAKYGHRSYDPNQLAIVDL